MLVSILILIAISCKKDLSYDDNINPSKDFTTAFVKTWYNKTFSKSPEFASFNQKENGKKQPDWKNGKYRKVGNMEILEFPLLKENKTISVKSESGLTSADKKRIASASLKRISFIKSAKNEIVIRELDYIPEWEYLKAKNFDISDVELGKDDNTFTGRIVTKKWSGEVLSVRKLIDGKIKSRLVSSLKKSGITKDKLPKNQGNNLWQCTQEEYCDETEMCEMEWVCVGESCAYQFVVPDNCYWVENCTVEEECQWVEDEPVCNYGSNESCECQLYGVGCSGGGGGNEDPPPPAVTINSVTNDLTDPCQQNAFSAISSANLRNELTKLYQQTFVGNNKVHNLTIGESSMGGSTLPGRSSPDPLNSDTWIIDLNNGYAHQLTKELWGSVILHEMVHGFIQKNALDFSPTSSFSSAHEIMLDKWICQLAAALKEAFGLTDTDALALSLEGFDDVLKDTNNNFKDDMKQWMQTKYSVNLAQMSQIADDYYTGINGTPCP